MADIRVTGAARAPKQATTFDPSQHPAYARSAPAASRGYGSNAQHAQAQGHPEEVEPAAAYVPAAQAAQTYTEPQYDAAQQAASAHAPQVSQASETPQALRVTVGYFAPQPEIAAQSHAADDAAQAQYAAQTQYAGQGAQPAERAPQSAAPTMAAALMSSARMPSAAGAQRMANLAGAVVSLALVVGLGVWGYKLLARDVSGVPVIRAAAGPMRVAPETPGGRPADYQGFSVNQVAAEGAAAKPADRLVLAPKPVDLTAEDTPAVAGAVPAAPQAPQAAQVDISAGGAALPQGKLADIQALAAQLAAGSTPMDETAPIKASASVVAPMVAVAPPAKVVTPAPKSGLARSLRPRLRPAGLQKASASGPVEAALKSAARAGEIDAASLPVGTRLAQLGTFDTADGARAGWHKLDARFGDLLEGKSLVVQQATSGGRVFYRLRAHGFDDINEARRFCAAFVSEGVECFPVATR